ncbi:MAG: nicotinate-nucleotide adenylyltransferase [Chromatiaceae bacterium]|nr:nicotinate-nucleotide adenylyltransferase [Chromatiaceae bacterium]
MTKAVVTKPGIAKEVGILGGTFDPVHQGHIACADFVRRYCQLDEVRLMPCHLPAHRISPGVDGPSRAEMVKLAIQHHQALALELLELNKDTPSYTVDSLKLLSEREPDSRFYFIIGMDSLCYFRQWKNWQGILQHCHLLVCQRPGYQVSEGDAPYLLEHYGVDSLSAMKQQATGAILLLPNPLNDISASQIRQQLQQGALPAALDPAVLNYIQSRQLYR